MRLAFALVCFFPSDQLRLSRLSGYRLAAHRAQRMIDAMLVDFVEEGPTDWNFTGVRHEA